MKKTIIASALAAALCSMAQGLTLEDAVASQNITASTGFTTITMNSDLTPSFAVTLTLDAQKMTEILGDATTTTSTLTKLFSLTSTGSNSTSTGYIGVSVGTPASDKNGFYLNTLLASSDSGVSEVSQRYGASNGNISNLGSLGNVTEMSFTFQVSSSNSNRGTVYLSYTTEDGTTNTNGYRATNDIFGTNYSVNELVVNNAYVTSVYAFNSPVNNGNNAYSLNSTALEALPVPEPTTATLSLLALAGLAARRRRK